MALLSQNAVNGIVEGITLLDFAESKPALAYTCSLCV